jgi:hypothetical protein
MDSSISQHGIVSLEGIRCDIPMFREQNRLSHDVYLLSFNAQLRECYGFSVQMHLTRSDLGPFSG